MCLFFLQDVRSKLATLSAALRKLRLRAGFTALQHHHALAQDVQLLLPHLLHVRSASVAGRRRAECFAAWRELTSDMRRRRQQAADVAARSDRWLADQLRTASVAHWRMLQLRARLQHQACAAVDGWWQLQLLHRALHAWLRHVKRCAVIKARASGVQSPLSWRMQLQRLVLPASPSGAAGSAGSPFCPAAGTNGTPADGPAPPPCTARRELWDACRLEAEATCDEIDHLEFHLRFAFAGEPCCSSSGGPAGCTGPSTSCGVVSGGGSSRLLLGQWHHKQAVLALLRRLAHHRKRVVEEMGTAGGSTSLAELQQRVAAARGAWDACAKADATLAAAYEAQQQAALQADGAAQVASERLEAARRSRLEQQQAVRQLQQEEADQKAELQQAEAAHTCAAEMRVMADRVTQQNAALLADAQHDARRAQQEVLVAQEQHCQVRASLKQLEIQLSELTEQYALGAGRCGEAFGKIEAVRRQRTTAVEAAQLAQQLVDHYAAVAVSAASAVEAAVQRQASHSTDVVRPAHAAAAASAAQVQAAAERLMAVQGRLQEARDAVVACEEQEWAASSELPRALEQQQAAALAAGAAEGRSRHAREELAAAEAACMPLAMPLERALHHARQSCRALRGLAAYPPGLVRAVLERAAEQGEQQLGHVGLEATEAETLVAAELEAAEAAPPAVGTNAGFARLLACLAWDRESIGQEDGRSEDAGTESPAASKRAKMRHAVQVSRWRARILASLRPAAPAGSVASDKPPARRLRWQGEDGNGAAGTPSSVGAVAASGSSGSSSDSLPTSFAFSPICGSPSPRNRLAAAATRFRGATASPPAGVAAVCRIARFEPSPLGASSPTMAASVGSCPSPCAGAAASHCQQHVYATTGNSQQPGVGSATVSSCGSPATTASVALEAAAGTDAACSGAASPGSYTDAVDTDVSTPTPAALRNSRAVWPDRPDLSSPPPNVKFALWQFYGRRLVGRALAALRKATDCAAQRVRIARAAYQQQLMRRALHNLHHARTLVACRAAQHARTSVFRKCFCWWRAWQQRRLLQWANVEAARRYRARRALQLWRDWASEETHLREVGEQGQLRHEHWLLVGAFAKLRRHAHARALLTRVFARAERAWAQAQDGQRGIIRYPGNFHRLHDAFFQWATWARLRRAERRRRVAQETADAFWRTATLLRCFRALQAGQVARQVLRERELLRAQLFLAWRAVARICSRSPYSRASVRRRLRKLGRPNECELRNSRLLRQAFAALAGPLLIAGRHRQAALKAKALAALLQAATRTQMLVTYLRHRQTVTMPLERALRAWREAAAGRIEEARHKEQAAAAFRRQSVRHKSLTILSAYASLRRSLRSSSSGTASGSGSPAPSTQGSEGSVAGDAQKAVGRSSWATAAGEEAEMQQPAAAVQFSTFWAPQTLLLPPAAVPKAPAAAVAGGAADPAAATASAATGTTHLVALSRPYRVSEPVSVAPPPVASAASCPTEPIPSTDKSAAAGAVTDFRHGGTRRQQRPATSLQEHPAVIRLAPVAAGAAQRRTVSAQPQAKAVTASTVVVRVPTTAAMPDPSIAAAPPRRASEPQSRKWTVLQPPSAAASRGNRFTTGSSVASSSSNTRSSAAAVQDAMRLADQALANSGNVLASSKAAAAGAAAEDDANCSAAKGAGDAPQSLRATRDDHGAVVRFDYVQNPFLRVW